MQNMGKATQKSSIYLNQDYNISVGGASLGIDSVWRALNTLLPILIRLKRIEAQCLPLYVSRY